MTSPRRFRVAALLVSAWALLGNGADPDSAGALLGAVQARYDAVADFRAEFTQVSVTVALGDEATARGAVFVRRPGLLRWSYEDGRVILLDPTTLRIYSPEDRQLQVLALQEGGIAPTALGFLLGSARLTEAFRPTRIASERPEAGLALDPKSDQGVERVELWVDPESLQLRESLVVDLVGNRTRLRFDAVRENEGIDLSSFDLDVPEGTEVIDLR